MTSKTLNGKPLKLIENIPTLGEFFLSSAKKYSDRICQIDANIDKSESYESVKTRSISLALSLQNEINQGDVVLICSPNTLDNPIAQIASFYLGAIVGNLDPSLSVQHVRHLCTTVVPKLIFVSEGSVVLIDDALKETTLLPKIIVFGKSDKYQSFSALTTLNLKGDIKPRKTSLDDPAILVFSSGTSGLPKAIIHTHRSTITMGLIFHSIFSTDDEPVLHVYYHLSSFYWVSGIMIFVATFMHGHIRVFSKDLSGEDLYSLIEKYKISNIFMAPLQTNKFTSVTNWKKYNTKTLINLLIAGGAISVIRLDELTNILKFTKVINGYGTTEAGGVTAFSYKDNKRLSQSKIVSVGKPNAGVQIKIVDAASGQTLGPNQNGEIRIKSKANMTGYYNLPSSDAFDSDGFVKSGDVGYYDNDGYIYVVDRLKEMFKYQSWHIVPTVLETILLEHVGISEAVVFGIPHAEDGDVPTACIVPKVGVKLNTKEVAEFVAEKVLDREKLRGGVFVVDKFPMTPSGKIMRNKVKEDVIKLIKNI